MSGRRRLDPSRSPGLLAGGLLALGLGAAGLPACLPSPGPDGGPSCDVELPCGAAPTEVLRFEPGPSPALVRPSDGTRLVLGEARRVDVQTTLGFGADDRGNPFRQNHCDLGLQLQYVDDVSGEDYDGSPNGDDVLVRVVTVPGGAVEVTSGAATVTVAVGATATDVTAAIGGFEAPLDRAGVELHATSEGLSLLTLGGEIEQAGLSVLPGETGRFALPIVLDTGDLGEGPASISTRDSRFADLRPLLGAPSAEAIAQSDLLLVDARVATWPALGVRIAGACPVIGVCDEQTRVTSILLSAPFMGEGEGGLGLFSEKDAFDAHFSSAGTEVDGVIVYSGATDLGVVYATFRDCTERAVGLILDHRVTP